LYLIFLRFPIFLKVGKFAAFSERPKAKSVSDSRKLCSLCPWSLPLDPAGASTPYPHYGSLTLVSGGL